MKKVDRIFRNVDENLNEVDDFLIECDNSMIKKYKSFIFYPDELTEYEYQYISKNELEIDGHTGSYKTTKIENCIIQDVIVFNHPAINNIEFMEEYYLEYFPMKEPDIKIKLKVTLKENISEYMNKPILIGYINDKDEEYTIKKIESRGPFRCVKNDEFIEVYATEPYNDPNKKYTININYKI